jgi:hypothetical protein
MWYMVWVLYTHTHIHNDTYLVTEEAMGRQGSWPTVAPVKPYTELAETYVYEAQEVGGVCMSMYV